ncbi:MAG TPA: hypothetical protein VIV35_05715 [Chitinophagaceae bacterium]
MLTGYTKNICKAKTGKKNLLFFLLLFPVLVQAQNDTTMLADSLSPEIREPPGEYQPPSTESDVDTKNDFFLKKWDSPGDSSIIQRHVPDSIIKKMQQDDNFWYANAQIKEEEKPGDQEPVFTPIARQQWFQTLLWLIIIGGFAAAVMGYLAGSNVGLFRKKNKALQTTGEEEPDTEDIFAINYQKEIDKAEAGGNYRLAIRLMFLRLLKDMAEKNIIQYKQDRTNLDYLFQLHSTGYYNSFFRITRNYEYSWYGQLEVGEDAYRIVQNDFNRFDRQIR